MKALLIAGTGSGVGKTTAAVGLMAAFRRRGLRVQGFKVGPDFIDPGYHTAATGIPSRNLDGWMLSQETNRALFAKWAGEADLSIIEGAMGLFDGYGTTEEGSAAQMAKWLDVPVILVVDAKGMSRSAGAILLGYEKFDPDLRLCGALFNRIGSENHFGLLKEAVGGDAAVVGGLPRDEALALPERHLGLMRAEEVLSGLWIDRLVGSIEKWVDLDLLLQIASQCPLASAPTIRKGKDRKVRIGVARDDAFSFYYQDNLDLLEDAGAELVYFSPTRDNALPASVQALYLGGGYPELHARALSENISLMKEIRARGEAGLPIYAECGGLIYLTEGIFEASGSFHPLVGLFPTRARMLEKRNTLGYVEIVLREDCLLGKAGGKGRGHEFHYSELTDALEGRSSVRSVYEAKSRSGKGAPSGFQYKNVLASYVHLHFHSNPILAEGLLGAALSSRCIDYPDRLDV